METFLQPALTFGKFLLSKLNPISLKISFAAYQETYLHQNHQQLESQAWAFTDPVLISNIESHLIY